jgi:CBS domain containing-hemolysin-like protein
MAVMVLVIVITLSKAALLSLTPDDIVNLRLHSSRRAHAAVLLLEHPELLITTIVFVNTVVWLILITGISIWIIVSWLIIPAATIIVFISEVLLKAYAVKWNERIARATAPAWLIMLRLCKPWSLPLRKVRQWIEKKFRKQLDDPSLEELTEVFGLSTKDDESEESEKEILRGAITFTRLNARQIMIPAKNVVAISNRLTFHQLIAQTNSMDYARILVYAETIDKIEGILYTKDLLAFLDESELFNWQSLVRPAFFVRETQKIDLLLRDFLQKRIKMAIVINNTGRTSGLVTLHDLSEEIVGDINNDFDNALAIYRRVDDTTFLFAGDIAMTDLYTLLLSNAPPANGNGENNLSLHEQMLEWNGKLPALGDVISYEQFTFTVESIQQRQIKQVRVQIHERQKH